VDAVSLYKTRSIEPSSPSRLSTLEKDASRYHFSLTQPLDSQQALIMPLVNNTLQHIGVAKPIEGNGTGGLIKKMLNAVSLDYAFPTDSRRNDSDSLANRIRSWYDGDNTIKNSADIEAYIQKPLFGSEQLTHGDVFLASEIGAALTSLPKALTSLSKLSSLAHDTPIVTNQTHELSSVTAEIEKLKNIGVNAPNYSKTLQSHINDKVGVVGEGKLNLLEYHQAKDIANKYDTRLDVVGSRGSAKGREIYKMNLPVGKDLDDAPKTTRSDLDFRIDTQHPQVNNIIEDIKKIGRGAGNASLKHGTDHRPTYPPYFSILPDPQ